MQPSPALPLWPNRAGSPGHGLTLGWLTADAVMERASAPPPPPPPNVAIKAIQLEIFHGALSFRAVTPKNRSTQPQVSCGRIAVIW